MRQQLLFGVSVAFGFLVWGIIAWRYIWPVLRTRSRRDALTPVLLLHSFRFVGLSFLVPGVVSSDLPAAFAGPAAYGDLVTAILGCSHSRRWRLPWVRFWCGCSMSWVRSISCSPYTKGIVPA
jgi:hypothetical protein